MFTDIFLFFILCIIIAAWAIAMYMIVALLKTKVPLVPTPKRISKKMIALAEIKKNKKIYDLGSGLGHVLLEAEKAHPENTFHGYDLLAPAVFWSNKKSLFLRKKSKFFCKDFFTQDLKDADVIFCYLWPSIMDRFHQEIYPTLKPGTKIISHAFRIKPLQALKKEKVGRASIYLYIKN